LSPTLTNWAGNIVFRAGEVHRPETLEELRTLVTRADKVRVLGSGHSFNDIADSPGVLVSPSRLPRELELDTAAGAVRVSAGIRYAELSAWLHERGFALHNLASLPHISVAGSCATATHGSGDGNGNLATAVRALTLVTAEGDLVDLDRERDGDRFRGAVVGLGALGVVVSMTLDVEPTFEVRQRVYEDLPLEAACDHFSDIMGCAYSVSMFSDWTSSRINQVWVKERVDEDGSRPPGPASFGARPADGPRHPIARMPAGNCTEQLGVPGPWFARLPHFRPEFTPSGGQERQAEYLVPRRHAVAALRELAAIGDRIAPVLQISEIRTIAADDLWLSPCQGRDTVGFHFTLIPDTAAVLPVLELIEERLAPFEARPHWGKLFTTPPAVLRSRYDRLPDFQALARDLDPGGKFANEFISRNLLDA